MLLDLTNTSKKAIIDDKNLIRVNQYKWFLKRVRPNSFYVATSIRKNGKVRTLYLHRFIMHPSSGMDVHHEDRNTLNNLEENLEEKIAKLHRCNHLVEGRAILKQRHPSNDNIEGNKGYRYEQ